MERLTLLFFSLWALVLPAGVLAQTDPDFASIGQKIVSFDSNITIDKNNIADVRETIVYSFSDSSHHGIFRVVPTAFRGQNGRTYYSPVVIESVTNQAGMPQPIKLTKYDRDVEVRIGDPNVLLNADQHTYIINYRLGPIATEQTGFDLLNLNVTGNGWVVPIDQVAASITTPAPLTEAICFTGVSGSMAHNCKLSQAGNTTQVVAGPLAAQEGLTVRGQLPTATFSQYPSSLPNDIRLRIWLVGISGLVIMFAFLIWLWQLARNAWHKHDQTIVPEYEPPEGLTPGEIGVLDDRRSNQVEISATIIDLAVRKYLKIDQLKAPMWYRKGKYQLTRLEENAPLRDYERDLVESLFTGGNIVDLSKLKYNQALARKISSAVRDVKQKLKTSVEDKGYYTKSFDNPLHAVAVWISLAVWVAILVVILNATSTVGQKNLLIWAMPLASALLAWAALTRANLTKSGLAEWSRVEGFKWFLSMTEKDRLKFTDAPKRTPQLFSKMLPYAVALKVEKQWAKQFDGVNISGQTYWYGGAYTFSNPSDLASNLSSGLISSMNSSFSSGGGGSGGGGGGGGGGGW